METMSWGARLVGLGSTFGSAGTGEGTAGIGGSGASGTTGGCT